jgi:hypothetical protein
MRERQSSILNRFTLAVALLSFAAALGAQAQQWKTYSYPSDGFSASFPSEPQLTKKDVPAGTGTRELRIYLANDDPAGMMVGVGDYGAEAAGQDPNVLLQIAKNKISYSPLKEKKITLSGYPGLELEGEGDSIHYIIRIFFVGTILYQMQVAYPSDTPYASATRFLDSFRLIPRVSQ